VRGFRLAKLHGASFRLVELAELLCVPVVEPRAAGYVNFPRDHLMHAGFDAAPDLADADFVLVLEARGPWHPASAGSKAGARVAILSENPLHASFLIGVEGWSAKTNTFLGTSITPSPDYAVLAQALGAHAEKVEEPSDVRSALERGLKALSAGRAAIIDMRLGSVN
jgi:hypothetical protein